MLDRNPLSPTYGCFDGSTGITGRRTSCGNERGNIFPWWLALAWHGHPQNPFFKKSRLRELVEAGVRFAQDRASDGSFATTFPFEKARWRSGISALATPRLSVARTQGRIVSFSACGRLVGSHQESGRLANHQALARWALQNVHALTGERDSRPARTLCDLPWSGKTRSWFQNNEGADPVIRLHHFVSSSNCGGKPVTRGDGAAARAARFAAHFMHPDGCMRRIRSRNTYHFYPHGFVVAPGGSAEALQVANCLAQGLPAAPVFSTTTNACAPLCL